MTSTFSKRGFTLMETVIAIGIVGILLTTFIGVFGPATQIIRKSINANEADRLARAVDVELTTLSPDEATSGVQTAFDKAFDIIRDGRDVEKPLLAFQYRAEMTNAATGGPPAPFASSENEGGQPGKDFKVTPIVFELGEEPHNLQQMLDASEGRIFYVRLTQLVFDGGSLVDGDEGVIFDPIAQSTAADPATFEDAVITYRADFYDLPAKAAGFYGASLTKYINERIVVTNNQGREPIAPVFSRNMAARR